MTQTLKLSDTARAQAQAHIDLWKPRLEHYRKQPRPSLRLIQEHEKVCGYCGGAGCMWCPKD
jgi:hypothetical protein